jgi:hypothetical protein
VGQVQQNFPEIHVTKGYEAGEQARTIRDTLADQAFAEASAKYRAAETMADTEGVVIPSGGIRNEAGAILEEFYGKVDPSAIPAEVKSVLTATRGVKGPEVETPGHIGGFVEAKEAEATASKGKDLSLKEANNVVVALGKAETKARGQQNWTAADNARALKDKMLKSIEDSKMSPAAKAAYIDARDNYRTNYAQRFQEGMGKQLGKEQGQGSAVAGREALVGNKVLGTALIDENNMREWDKVYGNNPEARALMSAELESRFRKTLADSRTPDALERQLKAFKDKYDFALARYPQVADKMEKGGAAQMRLQLQRKAELERYEFIMSGDITKAVGPVQAKIMFEKALADPDKMRALIAAFPEGGGGAAKRLTKELFLQANPFRSGEYDQDALYKMLNAGRKDQFSPSTLQLLFDSAFGKEAGAKHLHVLEAIGRFTEREAAVNPVNLRPQSLISDAPVSQGSGSTMASHLSNLRNMETGRSGSTFVATLSLSRLVNTKVQQAVEAAKIKALYDPETAEAVLALAATPINKPVAYGMMKLVLGGIKLENGTSLLDHMVDKGYVKKYVSRGIIAGIETASEDEDKRSTAVRR